MKRAAIECSEATAVRPRRDEGSYRLARRPATALVLLLASLFSACFTTPISGKTAFVPFSKDVDVQLGQEALAQYVDSSKEVKSGKDATMVKRIMDRLVQAAGDDAQDYDWSVRLIDEPKTVNAFALPGGPMAVYTGILPVTESEAGLAVVMGHEIGHVLARHGAQRMTRDMGAQLVLSMIDLGSWGDLAAAGYQFTVSLPFGRGDESEADEIGIHLMARAGYDPSEAISFWERMSAMSGEQPPEFLSTHPSHETRVRRLKELLPEATQEYQAATGGPKGLAPGR